MLKMQLISPCWQGRIPEWYDGGKKKPLKNYIHALKISIKYKQLMHSKETHNK